MKVYFDNRSHIFVPELIEEDIKQALNVTLVEENIRYNTEISVSFVNKEEIRHLNSQWRGKDSYTDVLSFPTDDIPMNGKGIVPIGDIVLCIDVAKEQAVKLGHSLRREIIYLSVHSLLHLLGYDHENSDDKDVMRKKEKQIMHKLGVYKVATSDLKDINTEVYDEYNELVHDESIESKDDVTETTSSNEETDISNEEIDEPYFNEENFSVERLEEEKTRSNNEWEEKKKKSWKRQDYFGRDLSYEQQLQSKVKNSSAFQSFGFAADGILYSVINERNMRFDIVMAAIVLVSSLFFRFSKLEFALMSFSILAVLTAEMFNTAIECICDMVVGEDWNRFAKIAKDVSAGGVLLTAINAIIVGYLLFFDKVSLITESVYHKIVLNPSHLTFIALALVVILVIILKAIFYRGHGRPLHGGSVSGHVAIAFCLATIGFFLSKSTPISILFLLLAIIVGQSRYEAKIHTISEIVLGAFVGISVAGLLFIGFFS